MRFVCSMTTLVALVFCSATMLVGQEGEMPKPGPEFDVFKSDLGTWDVEIKLFTAPDEPTVSKGKETNRMLGRFWMLVDFQGSMMGMDFEGHGNYSYDAKKKQYVGTWIDSTSPNKMDMVGQYDKETKTMTYEGTAPGPDGKPAKHILTTKYKKDGTRVMTMHLKIGDGLMKIFEMNYTKAADDSGSESKE